MLSQGIEQVHHAFYYLNRRLTDFTSFFGVRYSLFGIHVAIVAILNQIAYYEIFMTNPSCTREKEATSRG
jgi:hypothetical protein